MGIIRDYLNFRQGFQTRCNDKRNFEIKNGLK